MEYILFLNNSKLTNKEVEKARKLHREGVINNKLAKYYNISPTAMSKILRGLTYKNI